MARAEDTILRRWMALEQERGQLRGQIIHNLQVDGDEFEWAMAGIESALKKLREIEAERVVLTTILDVTKMNTEYEERQK